MAKKLKTGMIIPLALLAFIPIMAASWGFFYMKQKANLELAANPTTTAETLAELGEDGNLDVQLRVALNPSTPHATIETLSENPTLRYYLIFERTAPSLVIDAVAKDPNSKKPMLVAAAGHRNASVAALDALSGHPDPEIRLEVARNPKVRQEILMRLSGDDDPEVVRAAKDMMDNR